MSEQWSPIPPQREPRFSIRPGRTTNAAAGALIGAAVTAAYAIPEPLTRALTLGGLAALVYGVGLFQPRPRS